MQTKLNIPQKEKIVVGCSAGPDSMALLHYLKNNYKNCTIICCHINHNVRKESKTEEKYLQNYCQKENIIFESTTIQEYKENNFENEARKKRYNFYNKILKKYHSKYLFLAHHGDDLIETILMKIARGSNLEGYAGIKEVSKWNNYYIIRPFLKYTKEDLINYDKKNNIKYYIDSTNSNQQYTRNRYRENILPFLKKEDKQIHIKYLNYSKILLEYFDYINEEGKKLSKKITKNNTINIEKIKKIPILMQKNILYTLLNKYYNNEPNIITSKHITSILKQINSIKPNTIINLPKNTISKRNYNILTIQPNQSPKNENYKIELKKQIEINNIIIKKIKETEKDGNDICRINSNNIKLPLYIRNKKKGDKIEVKGLNGTKKISDIFIEKKISPEVRDTYPILVDANDTIIWIPNIKKSKFNSKKNEFYDIILNSCEKGGKK